MRMQCVLALCLLALSSVVRAEDAAEKPKEADVVAQPEDLSKAIGEGIKMLEEKKYKAFLERFVHPDDLDKVKADGDGSIDKLAENFGNGKAAGLLTILKAIQSQKVALSEGGKKAVFTLNDPNAPKGAIKFGKVEDKWYIFN